MNLRVGMMWHGDREARDRSDVDASKLALAAKAFREVGLEPEAVVYSDDFRDEVRDQLLHLGAVQVWVNPIEGGRDRSRLDSLLREVAARGVLVYTHPDTILKMGTKEVLVQTKDMSWGSDVHLVQSLVELRSNLKERLLGGRARVLKQYRGHSGGGIWKVSLSDPSVASIDEGTLMLLRHAARGSVEETVAFSDVLSRMAPYFEGGGRMIDQEYQERLVDGTVRCYMVGDAVGGFGHQAINALYPATDERAQPGPRLYHPPNAPEFAAIKEKMDTEWLDDLLGRLGMKRADLPLLWDADFFFGPKDDLGRDTYVLCEINVSSVYPYPESANVPLAQELRRRLENRDRVR